MKIAVASEGKELTSKVDPRFARSAYFIIYDTESDDHEIIDNSQTANTAQGAGVQVTGQMADKNINVVVAGNFGPKAFEALNASGIKAAQVNDGTIADVIEMAKNNNLPLSDGANVDGHWK